MQKVLENFIPAESSWWWKGLQKGFAFVALVIISPILIVAAAAIKLDSKGPVLYKQKRPGHRGKDFFVLKLRTMAENADRNPARARRVSSDDSCVTSVGRVLRKIRFDELPQLWNVVKGEMELVGPRPIAKSLHNELVENVEDFAFRLVVPPGVTSLAQLEASDDEGQENVIADWSRRFAIEKHYIAMKSSGYDLLVIALTVHHLLTRVMQLGVPKSMAVRANIGMDKKQVGDGVTQ